MEIDLKKTLSIVFTALIDGALGWVGYTYFGEMISLVTSANATGFSDSWQ
jgi:hypothetical protein